MGAMFLLKLFFRTIFLYWKLGWPFYWSLIWEFVVFFTYLILCQNIQNWYHMATHSLFNSLGEKHKFSRSLFVGFRSLSPLISWELNLTANKLWWSAGPRCPHCVAGDAETVLCSRRSIGGARKSSFCAQICRLSTRRAAPAARCRPRWTDPAVPEV